MTILNIKNARKLFPKEYTKVREEDFMKIMPNQTKEKYPKGHFVNKMNSIFDNLFRNSKGQSEYLAIRKGTKVKFVSL